MRATWKLEYVFAAQTFDPCETSEQYGVELNWQHKIEEKKSIKLRIHDTLLVDSRRGERIRESSDEQKRRIERDTYLLGELSGGQRG